MRARDPGARAWPLAADVVAVLVAGGLHALAFAPNDAPWLQTLTVALLAWRVAAGASAARAALLGLLFSTAWLVGGVWWLYISMHRYGGLPAWMAASAVLALCAFLSLYLAAAMAAWVRLRSGRVALDALSFAALWLLAEWARGAIFTGFPWIAAGYAHSDGPLAALAPWVGVYGIGAVSAGLAAVAAGALSGAARGTTSRWRWRLRLAFAFVAWWAPAFAVSVAPAAFEFSRSNGSLSVALVQTNVPQDEKFRVERQPEAIDWMLRALTGAQAELVVLPETAIPLLPEQLPAGFLDSLAARFSEGSRSALVGLPLGEIAKNEYTNSAAGLSASASTLAGGFYRYDKHHLVPFGEFIPFGFRWFVDAMKMPLGDFTRGPLVAPSFEVGAQRVAPNICYEDLFGEELAARFVDEARAPTILANLSNIAWFGDTVAIDQHLQISRLRSLELQRPMIRATNTGATVAIDHRGRVTQQIAPHTRGVLEATVEGRVGTTPYAAWAGRFGLWPLVAAALLAIAFAAAAGRRRG
ncbi:apolipoprotein N-acyltransferase [Methylibium sp.]|uniref:apolipoprotein N-acyltransferase n=1 Tax=Methylibium sp. TaxID=2067992 RepID=UPI0039C96D62